MSVHSALVIEFIIPMVLKEIDFNETCFDFKHTDFAGFLYSLNSYNWSDTFNDLNIN